MLSTFHLLFLPIFSLAFPPAKTVYKRWKSGASDYHTTRSSYSTCLPSYKADTETRTLNLLITNQTHNRLCYISVYLFILHSIPFTIQKRAMHHYMTLFLNYMLNFHNKNLNLKGVDTSALHLSLFLILFFWCKCFCYTV